MSRLRSMSSTMLTLSLVLVLAPLLVLAPFVWQKAIVPQPLDKKEAIEPVVVLGEPYEEGAAEGAGSDPDGGHARQTDWFWQQRAYPLTTVPGGYAQTAMEQVRRMVAPQQANAWQLLGPAPIQESVIGFPANGAPLRTTASGRVKQIVRVPGTNTIYIATSNSGIWRSDNLGQSWRPLTASLPDFSFHSLVIDRNNPNLLYAGTGEIAGYFGNGILKTTDGGQTWTRLGQNEFGNLAVTQIIVHPTNSNIVYASTSFAIGPSAPPYHVPQASVSVNAGVFRSNDGGQTWTRLRQVSGRTSGFSDLVMDDSNPNVLYAAEYSVGVHKTTDGGQTWSTQTLPNLSQRRAQRVELAIGSGAAGAQTLFAGVAGTKNNAAWGIVYATTDGGTTWRELINAPNYCQDQCFYDNIILVDPRNPRRIYLGGSLNSGNVTGKGAWFGVIWRSDDGGANWTDLTPGTVIAQMVHPDMHALIADPDNPAVVWAGNDGGLFRYDGTKWDAVNGNLNSTLIVGLTVSKDGTRAFAGLQDNAHLLYDGTTWRGIVSGDGGNAAFDATNQNVVYSTFYNLPGEAEGGVSLTRFEGATIEVMRQSSNNLRNEGINSSDDMLFYVPVEADPQQGGVVYVGTNRVYTTRNSGNSWSTISNQFDETVRSIAVGDASTVYAGTIGGKIFALRQQASGTWNTTDLSKTNLPPRYLSDIEPVDANTIYLAYNGFSANTSQLPGHVFKTNDGGATWVRIDGTGAGALPDIPVLAILRVQNTLYVGTDVGVFRSDNDGASWVPFNTGLPPVPVTQLRYNTATNTVWAGTYGRGVVRITHSAAQTPATATTGANTPTTTPTATSTATNTPSATATTGPTNTPTLTPTPPTTGPLPGSWSGERMTFGVTNNQRSIYNLRVLVSEPGLCTAWFSTPEIVPISAQGTFSVTVNTRDGRWSATGTISPDGRSAIGTATFINVNTGTSVCGGSFNGTITWTATWQASAPDPTAVPPTPAPPTATPSVSGGISGQVRFKGQGVPGIVLTLRTCPADPNADCDFFSGNTIVLTTTTDPGGFYTFINAPSLPAGQVYQVFYFNDPEGGNEANDTYLWRWFGERIPAYTAGQSLSGGSFDLADILLLDPVIPADQETATSDLPITFTWEARVSGENYALLLFDEESGEAICVTDPAPTTSFVLTEQFFREQCNGQRGRLYGWYVWALNSTTFDNGGFGDSYYYSSVTVKGSTSFIPLLTGGRSNGAAVQAAPAPTQSLPAALRRRW